MAALLTIVHMRASFQLVSAAAGLSGGFFLVNVFQPVFNIDFTNAPTTAVEPARANVYTFWLENKDLVFIILGI
jgi:hypothetical protein